MTGTIDGTVTDGNGDGIGNATVTVTDAQTGDVAAETRTDSTGSYSVTVAADTYDVSGEKVGYSPDVTTGVNVSDGQTVTVDLTLAGLSARFIGEQETTNIGVHGRVTADSGLMVGVQGEVSSPDGYGLGTPNDARIDGTLDAGTLLANDAAASTLGADALNTADLEAAGAGRFLAPTSGTALSVATPTGTEVKAQGPAGDTWSDVSSPGTGRRLLAAAPLDGTVYAIGGDAIGGAIYESSVEAYDPGDDSWSTVASLNTGRRLLAGAAVDGRVYAIGGDSSDTADESTVEAYDPAADSWSTVASLNRGRDFLGAAAVDGKIYAVGGRSETDNYETTVEAYDPAADSWSTVASLNTGRSRLGVATHDGLLYAVGGESESIRHERTVEAYDPGTDSWTEVASLPTGTREFGAASGRFLYAIGGRTDKITRTATVYAYDPDSDEWFAVPALGTRSKGMAATSADGALFRIGGSSITGGEAGVERLAADPFDPAFTASRRLLVAVRGDEDAVTLDAGTAQSRTGDQQLLVRAGERVEWIGSSDATLYGIG